MSNMAEISQLTELSVQLPIDWYVDPKILEIVFTADNFPSFIAPFLGNPENRPSQKEH